MDTVAQRRLVADEIKSSFTETATGNWTFHDCRASKSTALTLESGLGVSERRIKSDPYRWDEMETNKAHLLLEMSSPDAACVKHLEDRGQIISSPKTQKVTRRKKKLSVKWVSRFNLFLSRKILRKWNHDAAARNCSGQDLET